MKRLFSRPLATSILTLSVSYLGVRPQRAKCHACLDPDADDGLGGTGTEVERYPHHRRTHVSRNDLGSAGRKALEAPRIAVIPIVNQTQFRVDPKLLQNKLLKSLVTHAKGKVTFLRGQ